MFSVYKPMLRLPCQNRVTSPSPSISESKNQYFVIFQQKQIDITTKQKHYWSLT